MCVRVCVWRQWGVTYFLCCRGQWFYELCQDGQSEESLPFHHPLSQSHEFLPSSLISFPYIIFAPISFLNCILYSPFFTSSTNWKVMVNNTVSQTIHSCVRALQSATMSMFLWQFIDKIFKRARANLFAYSNLRSYLLRCGTMWDEWGTQWDSNLLV